MLEQASTQLAVPQREGANNGQAHDGKIEELLRFVPGIVVPCIPSHGPEHVSPPIESPRRVFYESSPGPMQG